MSTSQITRLEVIDDTGRAFVSWDLASVELSYQDDGRTLKVFIRKRSGQFNNSLAMKFRELVQKGLEEAVVAKTIHRGPLATKLRELVKKRDLEEAAVKSVKVETYGGPS